MTGPIRSNPIAGSSRQQPAYKVQPPRPPNAWILYRSDRLKDLPPSKERRAQADVSKLISEMWKNEKEEVKLEYERMADARKAEHQRLYPSYRFQPMKKEDKERIREERKQEREQARLAKKSRGRSATAATTTAPTAPPLAYATPAYLMPTGYPPQMGMPHPYTVPYQPEARFGPAGPSPPLSAASSPNETSASPEPQPRPEENTAPSTSTSARPSPSPESQVSSSSSQPLPANTLYLPQQPPLPGSQQPSPNPYATQTLPQSQPSGPSQWQLPPSQPQLPPTQGAMLPVPQLQWNDMPSTQFLHIDSQNPEEFLNFDIAFNHAQSFAEFQQGISNDGLPFDALQGLLSMTGESGVFSLSNINPSDLLAHPLGELEVAMGSQASAYDFNGDLFANFDFSLLEQPLQPNQAINLDIDPLAVLPVPDDFASLFQTPNNPEIQAHTAAQQRQPSMFTQDVMQFLNLEVAEGSLQDASIPDTTTAVAPQQVRPPPVQHVQPMSIFTQMTNTPIAGGTGSYVPPAGAIHSSTRRVAASWKPSFALPNSPVEQPGQSWGVPAS